jgi:O-antigen/teichoic acid export membrane protein
MTLPLNTAADRHRGIESEAVATPQPIGAVRRIYGNLGKLLGGKAGAGIVSLIYMVIAVRVLGPRDYGVLILVHTYVMMIGGLIEFPGWHAVVRYGAQAIEEGDEQRLLKLLRFAGLVELAGGAVAVASAALLAPIIGPRLGWSETALAFALPYSFAALASIRATPAGDLQLFGRFDLLGAHVLVSPLVRLLGAGAIALLGGGLHAFLALWLAAALAEFLSMWALGLIVMRRKLPDASLLGSVSGVRQENAGIWRFMLAANADATFSDLAPRIAPLAIGWVIGPVAAALYAVAQRATVVIAQPAQLLGQAAYAELARLVAAGRREAIQHALARMIGIALAISTPALIVIGLAAHPLARLIGGPSFERAGDIMLLLAAARAVLLIGPPVSAALVALGRPGLSVTANIGAALGLLPLLPLMLTYWSLEGAALHALLQAVVAAGLLVWCLRREARSPEPAPES